jgi:hypothetical protein
MKRIGCTIFAAILLVLASSMSGYAGHGHFSGHGDHGHFSGGVFISPGWWGPGWGGAGWWGPPYYPYYYPQPQVIIQEREPETYIQQSPQADVPAYWYFCREPEGYYPYVKQCPKGWLKVVPSPPAEEGKE